jgi:tetratricopeptide (TPR) repeat protein
VRWLFPAFVSLVTSPGLQAHPDPLENIKIYTYILSVSSENPMVYFNRGICYRLVSDFESAIKDFDKAEQEGIKGRPLWMNRAMAYLPLKRFEEAYQDLSRIIEEDAADSSSYFYRGEVRFRQGRYREAIAEYDSALKLKQSHYLYFVRADSHRMTGETAQALEDYSQAVALAGHMVPYRIARARLLGSMGRFDEARTELDDALKRQPERYQIYTDRAILSASQGLEASKTADLRSAMKYIEDEIFFRPKDATVFADRAQVHELEGEVEKARMDFDQAVEFANPSDGKPLRLRAQFLSRHGEESRAAADLTQAAEVENQPIPTATPLPGPTLSLEDLRAQPTPNLLPEIQK